MHTSCLGMGLWGSLGVMVSLVYVRIKLIKRQNSSGQNRSNQKQFFLGKKIFNPKSGISLNNGGTVKARDVVLLYQDRCACSLAPGP